MNLTSKLEEKTFVFGKIIRRKPFSSDKIADLVQSARESQEKISLVTLDQIISVLDDVSKIWSNTNHPLVKEAITLLPDKINFSPEMVCEGLRVVAGICSKDSLLRRLRGEFGDFSVLDRLLSKSELGYAVKAIPIGPILHIAAGNVFVGIVDSLVSGIITKNANIVKMSSVDPIFPVLFMESLRLCDKEGLVWRSQAIIEWKGGDRAIESVLFNQIPAVIFWGGGEALQNVRSQVGINTKLIENGPKYSFAVTDKKALRSLNADWAIKNLAIDISRWDQQACSSPHLVYCISASERDIVLFMEKLSKYLDEIYNEIPTGKLSFDEKTEIRRVRELALMHEALGNGKIVCPDKFKFTLIYERDPVFKISCLNRTFFIKTVKSVRDLNDAVSPIKEFLQTVGIFVSDQIKNDLIETLFKLGVKRITDWGGMSEGKDGAPHEGSYFLTKLVNLVSIEFSRQSKSDARLDKLGKIFEQLAFSKFYRNRLSKAIIRAGLSLPKETKNQALIDLVAALDPLKILRAFPLLDRETLYQNSPPISDAIFTTKPTNAYVYASGGTSGTPKYILYSNDEYRRATDELTFIYTTAGLSSKDVVGNLFLAGNLWTSFNVAGRALENIGCINLPIGGMTDFNNLIRYLIDFKVNALVGLPSIFVKLAEEIKRRKITIKIEKLLYGGEHLRKPMQDFLFEVFKCDWIRSAGYACVDTGPIGYQCPYLSGTVHHVLEGYQFVEIINTRDLANGQITQCNIGEPGEIVCTNLDRLLMPIVRYRTGDLGKWVEIENCPCGFSGQSFELLGRCDDLIIVGGINLMPSDLAAGIALLPVSPNFQVVARTAHQRDLLVLRLETEKPLSNDEVLTALKKGSFKLMEAINDGWLNIEIEWFKPGCLPRNERTGKLKVIIDERE